MVSFTTMPLYSRENRIICSTDTSFGSDEMAKRENLAKVLSATVQAIC
jgi:hypothetical protein